VSVASPTGFSLKLGAAENDSTKNEGHIEGHFFLIEGHPEG
jgi:hypothetical protein